MSSIFHEYFILKLILIIVLIYSYYALNIKKISKLIFALIAIIVTLGLINDFFEGPSLKSNLKINKKIRNLSSNDLESIKIFQKNAVYYIEKDRDFDKIISSIKENRFGIFNRPEYVIDYKIIFNLKDKSIIQFKIVKAKSDDYGIILLNNYGNKIHEIGTYLNDELVDVVDSLIRKEVEKKQ